MVKGDYKIVGKMNVKSNLCVVNIDYIIPEFENRAFLLFYECHRNFSHQNMKYTRDLLKKYDIPFRDLKTCVSCLKGKAVVKPFTNRGNRTKVVGELIHIDLMGPMDLSLGKSKYALVFKDDCLSYRTVYFLKNK